MATRNTQNEANQLKTKLEKQYPNRKFRIVDNSRTMKMGRLAAEEEGYEILSGSVITVTAKVTSFTILEIRECGCGTEILTAAIGEDGLNECRECAKKSKEAHEANLNRSIAENKAEVDRYEAYSEFWN